LRQINLERKRKAMEAQIATLQTEFEAEEAEVRKLVEQEKSRRQTLAKNRESMAQKRKAD